MGNISKSAILLSSNVPSVKSSEGILSSMYSYLRTTSNPPSHPVTDRLGHGLYDLVTVHDVHFYVTDLDWPPAQSTGPARDVYGDGSMFEGDNCLRCIALLFII